MQQTKVVSVKLVILIALGGCFLWLFSFIGEYAGTKIEDTDSFGGDAKAIMAISGFVKLGLLSSFALLNLNDPNTSSCDSNNLNAQFVSIINGFLTLFYAWFFTAPVTRKSCSCFVGLVGFLIECFCVGELRKACTTPPMVVIKGYGGRAVDFGCFKFVAAIAVCITQNVFGFWSIYSCLIVVICFVLISLHNIIPRTFYCMDPYMGVFATKSSPYYCPDSRP